MEKTWTCTRCTFQNSPLNIRCVMCETRKATNPETGEWKCLKCTFSFNPPWIKVCDTCGTPREDLAASALPSAEVQENTWNCPACTYKFNEHFLTVCKMCGATNPRVVPAEGTTWTCSTCTLVNMIGADKCQACETAMPELALKMPNGGWICSVCTYKNSEGTKCKLCHAEQSSLKASAAEKKWQCSQCMHANSPSLYKCEMCRTPCRASAGVDELSSISSICSSSEDSDELRSLPTETIFKSQQAEIMKIWENICQFCRVHNTYFVDDSFLPRPQSISWSLQRPYINSIVKWFRPHEISRRSWTVYKNPTPDDIVQGNVGDCWLLCALAVIAERKELVENLIPNQYNPYGVFHVRLYMNGQWKTVIIDDLLPCDENGRMFFSRAKRHQLWVPLIEKAMAKMYGCYEALAGGTCLEGLYSLTGAPCVNLDLESESEDESWAYLLSSWESGFLVACACGDQGNVSDTKDYWQVGLKKDHAYSVLDVQEVEGNRLVKIRNPWSWFSWNGDWSKGSSLWEVIKPETKQQLLSNCGDGQFWMCFSDVRRNFYNMQVCKVRSDWQEMRIPGEFLPHAGVPIKVHILTVLTTAEFEISVFQDNNRSCIKEGKPWLPVDVLLIVFKYNKYGRSVLGDLVECKRKIGSVVNINPVLEAGQYVIVCLAFNHWKVEYNGQSSASIPKANVIPFTLVFHCTKDFLLQELRPSSKRYNEKYLLADIIIQLILERGRREHFANNVQVCSLVKGWAGSMIMVENLSPVHQATIRITCDPQKCTNIVSTRDNLSSIDVIPPLHRQVVMILTQKDKVKPYHVSYSLKFGHISGVLHDPPLSVMVKGLHTPRHI